MSVYLSWCDLGETVLTLLFINNLEYCQQHKKQTKSNNRQKGEMEKRRYGAGALKSLVVMLRLLGCMWG